MSKQLTYRIETLNLINQLASNISDNHIIVKKDEDNNKIIINRKNPSETISFFLETKLSDFDFEGDEISFYNFSEFYQLVSVFKDPTIVQDNNIFSVSKNTAKITYALSDVESLGGMPKNSKNLRLDDSQNCVFELSEVEIKNICKMISLLHSEEINVNVKDSKLKLTLQTELAENTFEKEFDIEFWDDSEINFNIPSEVFTIIPNGDYKISIWEVGAVILQLKSDEVLLKIMTAALEDRD